MIRDKIQPVKKLRRKGFSPKQLGKLVEIDTVSIFVDGLKRYLLTAIDLPNRFAFVYNYKSSITASKSRNHTRTKANIESIRNLYQS